MASQNADVSETKISDLFIDVFSKLFANKHSFCWTHFGHLVVKVDGKKRTILGEQVFCDVCLKNEKEKNSEELFKKTNVKAYSKNVATSNLIRHLKDDHNIEDKQKKKNIPIKDFFSTTRKPTAPVTKTESNKKWLLSRDLALWFAKSLMPFNSIDDAAMIDFFKKYNIIEDKEDLPSRYNIARDALEDVYNSMLLHIKDILSKENVRFGALTADMWTDQFRRRNYITCTFHFINKDMTLLKFTLATKQVTDKHTGEKIKTEIEDILRTFKIPSKNIVLVSDSGSNMKRAAHLLNMQNHLCLGHALHNLVNVDGIQKTDEVFHIITKCKKMVKHLRYRAPQLETAANKEQRELLSTFEDIGDDLDNTDEDASCDDSNEKDNPIASTSSGTGALPTIKTSTPTRWHSTLMMLSSISHNANRRPIRDMLIDIGHSALLLNENEYHLITNLTSFLNKFKQIVEILSSESQPTINLALVFKSEIKRILEQSEDAEPVLITKVKNNMLRKLDHRFPVTDVVVTAALLDCRFQAITEIDNFMDLHKMTKVGFLTSMVEFFLNNNIIAEKTQDAAPGTSSAFTSTSNFLVQLAVKHSPVQNDITCVVENECWKYFSTTTVNDILPYDGDILKYWKDRKSTFPWLSSLARAILFIPATSTPSERVFSVAGQVITAKRSSLHPLRVNKIIFIHDNYNHCQID